MGKEQDLLDAARNGSIEVVHKILAQNKKRNVGPLSSFRRGTNVNVQDVNGYTPLHHASLNGHATIVELLLQHDVVVDVRDIRGSTPLYVAAWAGHNDIVKMLLLNLEMSANPNSQTIDNDTPLHCAAQNGKHVALAILLANGGDPTIRNNSFETALDLAAKYGRLQCVQVLLRKHPELIEPLKSPVDQSRESILGHSPPYEHATSHTPSKHTFTHTCLHVASRNGHKEVVKTLLAAGVDVNIITNEGTALHEAALHGKKNVVVALLEANIDPYATDGKGRTALDIIRDFPPHVTYEIVSAINDYCNHFAIIKLNPKLIIDENANHESFQTRNDIDGPAIINDCNKSETMPNSTKQQYNNVIGEIKIRPKTSAQNTKHNYLVMRPIAPTICKSEMKEQPPPVLLSNLKGSRSCERIFSHEPANNSKHIKPNYKPLSESNQYLDNYVKMSKVSLTSSIEQKPHQHREPPPPLQLHKARKKPIPIPRTAYQHIDDDNNDARTADTPTDGDRSCFTTPTNSIRYQPAVSRRHHRNGHQHSPTPDFPPPTVSQAETTIYEFMQPSLSTNEKRSLPQPSPLSDGHDHDDEIREFENIAFIWENVSSGHDESHSSRTSDYFVEEFVGNEPFAGLFKGSTLTLNANSEGETGSNVPALERRCGLRSPSLVRAVKPVVRTPTPTKRHDHWRHNHQPSINVSTEEISVSKEWEEIDTILESIGSEATAASNTNGVEQHMDEGLDDEIKIRQPVDLALNVGSGGDSAACAGQGNGEGHTTNWCHSPNTLIYSHIMYNVYYLGSTVIRELRGTLSTRKSIQKLKLEETTEENEAPEETLLENCNNSTKILKANNQQTRLKVGISLSHVGVRFIDADNGVTMCVHEIENINCVCQDNEDLRYFAYITKENDIHYCHVFMVDNVALASEVIMTLGQAFEVAYQLAMRQQQEEMSTSMMTSIVSNVNVL